MSSIQEQIDALRWERDELDGRIQELEDTMRWQAKQKLRQEEAQHKEELLQIQVLRTKAPLVISNPELVEMLDKLVTWGGGTPHSQGHPWCMSEEGRIPMFRVVGGISLPSIYDGAWPDGITSVSGVFSYEEHQSSGDHFSYPKGSMIDLCLVYGNQQCHEKKGLVLKDSALLQLVPEKKVFASLNAWIADMGRPSFGAVRVRLNDPRTRHEKAQEALDKLGSFQEKIAYLTELYKLKQSARFRNSVKQNYEFAVQHYERTKERIQVALRRVDLDNPEAARIIAREARELKSVTKHKDASFTHMNSLSEEDRERRPAYIHNHWNSFLYTKDVVYGRCIVAKSPGGSIYHHKNGAQKWVPQGPTQVFLLWRRQEIPFNV